MNQHIFNRTVICRSLPVLHRCPPVAFRSWYHSRKPCTSPRCTATAPQTPRGFSLASPRRRSARREDPTPTSNQPRIFKPDFRQDSSSSDSDLQSLQELLSALQPQLGSDGTLHPGAELDGHPAFQALQAKLASATDAEKIAMLEYIKNDFETRAADLQQRLPPQALNQLGDVDVNEPLDQPLTAPLDPDTGRTVSDALVQVFDKEELDFMHRSTGIDWRHLENYNPDDWVEPLQSLLSYSKEDRTFLFKLGEKMELVSQRIDAAEEEIASQRDSQGASSSAAGTAPSGRRRRRRPRGMRSRSRGNARPGDAGPGGVDGESWGERGTGDASTSGQEAPSEADVLRQFDMVAAYQQQAIEGTLFPDERSKHFQQLAWIHEELDGLAAVDDPGAAGLTEEEYRAKFEEVAFRLSELMAALASGTLVDPAAIAVLRFVDTQLLDLSEDESNIMFLQSEPEDVQRLGRMMKAAENLVVLRDFAEAYIARAPAPEAQQVADNWKDWSTEDWWVKEDEELTYEERQLYRTRRRTPLPVPHWTKIGMLAQLDTDLLRFARDSVCCESMEEVFSKWYWHPVIGRRMMDGSLMTEGMPEVWSQLFELVAKGRSPEEAADELYTAGAGTTGLEYQDERGMWRTAAGQATARSS